MRALSDTPEDAIKDAIDYAMYVLFKYIKERAMASCIYNDTGLYCATNK